MMPHVPEEKCYVAVEYQRAGVIGFSGAGEGRIG